MNEHQNKTADGGRWLDKPRNVDRLVYALYAVCALLFLADLLYTKKAYFGFENWVGFYGWFGFASYVFIVLSAKLWRRVVKRDEDYYERER